MCLEKLVLFVRCFRQIDLHSRGLRSRAELSACKICREGNGEADEPCVIVKIRKECRHLALLENADLDQEAWQAGSNTGDEGQDRDQTKAVGISILALGLIKSGEVELPIPPDEIVSDQNPADWTK